MADEKKEEITKFDPNKLVDRVRERVRGTIADLIPEDAWTAMVKKEIDLFLKETTREAYNFNRNHERIPSGLATAVHDVLEEETKKRVKAILDSPEWGANWMVEGQVSNAVKDLVVKHAPEIVQSLLGNAVQQFVQNMRNGMGR